MQKFCDDCKRSAKDAGKLLKVKFLMLCKVCRRRIKRARR